MTDVQELIEFLKCSPTPFHAVRQLTRRLLDRGYQVLDESAEWDLHAGGRYCLTRNGSSLIAFRFGQDDLVDSGLRLLGAHTDSPCLKLKPKPVMRDHGYLRLGLEVYGGALLNPWFDRDLSIAGRVTVSIDDAIRHVLVDFQRPIAIIPSLAIHLDREQNSNRSVNAQEQLPAILALDETEERDLQEILLQQVRQQEPELQPRQVLDFDLFLYDTQAPAEIGLHKEFIAGARLDNLLSCFAGAEALLHSGEQSSAILVCNDHEEVGSMSAVGAKGPMLSALLQRLLPDPGRREQMIARSMLVSVDNAHGLHPNFAARHDEQHGPVLNQGPVIKVNASQRYATNSETAALFRWLCQQREVPVQSFVVRSDMACGSTIGPITAAELGIRSLDVGVPTFAMHSTRETAGSRDLDYLIRALTAFAGLTQLPL